MPVDPAVSIEATTIGDELILGIDGGGSHTLALLASRRDPRNIVAQGLGGPSNMRAGGADKALAALDEAVSAAFANLEQPRQSVAAAALGLAGIDSPQAADIVRQWAHFVSLAKRVAVDNDATLLLAAGTPNGWGLAVVAGTGSIAFARSADGRFDRSGGWGYLLGDEGSAYALALAGMRAVARAADGCAQPTRLTETIIPAMNLREPIEMIAAVYGSEWDRARLASLAPLIFDAADAGDVVAISIVDHEAMELARTTVAAARKLGLPSPTPVAITGGTMLNNPRYGDRFAAALRALGLEPEPVTLVSEPARGALKIARALLD